MSAEGTPERTIGRYALGQKIGSGGMATVHLGRVVGSIGFTRIVAIKRMHELFATDPKFVSMFIDEARLTARVRHPNVVPTLDVLVDQGEIFVVLEYVHGEPLHRLLRSLRPGERAPVRVASGIAFGVLIGLHAAHDARNSKDEPLHIVHRDVSPQNVLVGPDGVPRVLDFGIAQAIGRLRTTEQSEVKGKIAYSSPEQIRGEAVDQRTDVYAASVVLWELLTGRRLFQHDEPGAVLHHVLRGATEPPSATTPEVPPALDGVVMRGLAKSPAHRWPTARAMALALEDALPPATAPHIGAWAARAGSKPLAERAALIRAMEGAVAPVGFATILREVKATTTQGGAAPYEDDETTERELVAPGVPSSERGTLPGD